MARDLMAGDDFTSQVLEVVASIPSGRVMTYGDVAAVLGSRASRAVGSVLRLYGSDVPWWRVIRSGGLPPVGKADRALEHYRAESTPLRLGPDGSFLVDMRLARHAPD